MSAQKSTWQAFRFGIEARRQAPLCCRGGALMGIITKRDTPRLAQKLNLRLPRGLPQALEAAAEQRLLTVSEFVRLSIVNQLIADGIDPHGKGSDHKPPPPPVAAKRRAEGGAR
jgi:hypothetical protein